MRMRRLNSTTSIGNEHCHACNDDDDNDTIAASQQSNSNNESVKWIRACKLDELSNGQMYKFQDQNMSILLANQNNVICAVDSVCTHADADLSTGFLGPDGIRCPLHLSVFGLDDGVPKNPPAEKPLRVYDVKIDDGWVHVGV